MDLARITKMKDGRTHLTHKAEHAIDLESGAMVAVTLHGADVGDTTSVVETVAIAIEQVAAAQADRARPAALTELVADKGYHRNQTLSDLRAIGVRLYVSEPERGRRHWTKDPGAQRAAHGNRRRVRGARGQRLLRRRGEYPERSFAHVYDTGGMRRTHLRGHSNILKRLLVHASAFNLGLLTRQVCGRGHAARPPGPRRGGAFAATRPPYARREPLAGSPCASGVLTAPTVQLAPVFDVGARMLTAITCTTGC